MIPVYFTEKMVASIESFSPSAGKPRQVVDSWLKLGVPIRIVEPSPVTVDQLCLAHDREYVEGVLGLKIANGFGNTSKELAGTLPWTSGAMLSAAREALKNGAVAVAPASGYHHAGYSHAGGYCTFNSLIVTARVLLGEGIVKRVGVLDLDQHEGDGTNDIIHELRLESSVLHYTAGAKWHRVSQATSFLEILPCIVEEFSVCDVLLVQLGVDPHVDDPLGGWLSTEQLKQRDRIVFEAAKEMGVPCAWSIAGGYQQPLSKVLRLHDNTLLMCAKSYVPMASQEMQ